MARNVVTPGSSRPEPISLSEAAERLGVHYMTVYRYVRTGRLPATKVGAEWQIDPRDLDDLANAGGPAAPGRRPRRPDAQRRRLVERLAAGDEAGSWAVTQSALAGGLSPADLYVDVVGPALTSIGDQWSVGEVSVGQEHQASAVAARLVGRLGPLFSRPGRKRGTVVLGAPAGDRHGLPSALFADLLRGEGFEVIHLGADAPVASFVEAAQSAERLVAVGISVTSSRNGPAVAATIRAVREVTDAPVVVGGRAAGSASQVERLGARHWSGDTRQALELFGELADEARRARQTQSHAGPRLAAEMGPDA